MKSNVKVILITSALTSLIIGSSVGVGMWFGLSTLRTGTTNSTSTTKSTSSLKDRSIEWVNAFENTFVDYSGQLQDGFITSKALKSLNEKYQVYCGKVGRGRVDPITSGEYGFVPDREDLLATLKQYKLTGTLGTELVSLVAKATVWLCFEYTEIIT